MSPVHEVLVEQSVLGWKEYELEVMRDVADNFVVICSIENIDPMGIHTGDSITVAPAMTLSDKEYQRLRDMARRIISRVGVETGGSNIQFAVNPADGRVVAIEMNPRVSRSSALASKATGFPIAKIAAKLALGYHLDEIPNDITRVTPASFEPSIDYVVVKVPRWNFEKFPEADRTLTTQMKSVGEAMAIGRTFKEAFLKGLRSLELGRAALALGRGGEDEGEEALRAAAGGGRRAAHLAGVPRARARVERRAHPRDHADRSLVPVAVRRADGDGARRWASGGRGARPARLRALKQAGFSNREIARLSGRGRGGGRGGRARAGHPPGLQAHRHLRRGVRVVHAVPLQHLRRRVRGGPDAARKVVILGSGPNRIGQGIEFDYCCCHAAFALREEGVETVMVNCNPETVSTDYDTADRLYFEPLTLEDVLAIIEREREGGGDVSCLVQFGGQTPLKLALRAAPAPASRSSAPRPTRSTWRRTASASRRCSTASGSTSRRAAPRPRATEAARGRRRNRVPRGGPAVVRAGRPRHGDRLRAGRPRPVHDAAPWTPRPSTPC